MQRIVVAAKAGAEQPWVADAAAELAQQTGARGPSSASTGSTSRRSPPSARECAEAAARAAAERPRRATA